jgi:hypothetical protein
LLTQIRNLFAHHEIRPEKMERIGFSETTISVYRYKKSQYIFPQNILLLINI